MKQKAHVFYNNQLAGILSRKEGIYRFEYSEDYLTDKNAPSISLTLPKRQKPYESATLFPFFYGLLAEGDIKYLQCKLLQIDEQDDFTRLIRTAHSDTIGAITVKEIE